MTQLELYLYISEIRGAGERVMEKARQRQIDLAKPPGSLGELEDISIRLAGISGQVCTPVENCRVLVFAADNGVCEEGISSAPQSVTLKQCLNMQRHKTGMSALAKAFGCSIEVTDVGIDAEGPWEGIVDRKVRRGTRNLVREEAMTGEELMEAISAGIEAVERAKEDGVDAIGIGEMGIGNTTTSAAVLAALTDLSVEDVTGRGGGLDDKSFARKKQVIADALELHKPAQDNTLDILQKVGGLDLAAMTGAFIGCAANRIPAVVDGFISIVAALCAVRICPKVRDFLFLSHASYEVGYRAAAEELNLTPYLHLNMRLGEGSGCPIAFQLLKAAAAVMSGMATFAEGNINDDYLEEIREIDAFSVKKN